jgi:hypothetical protein
LSVIGLVPISAAIAGSAVEMTVASMFSMNSATARMSGMVRFKARSGLLGRKRIFGRLAWALN